MPDKGSLGALSGCRMWDVVVAKRHAEPIRRVLAQRLSFFSFRDRVCCMGVQWICLEPTECGGFSCVARDLGFLRNSTGSGGTFWQTVCCENMQIRPKPSDKWYFDEVVILIRGKRHRLWRAVDSNGDVLDILI